MAEESKVAFAPEIDISNVIMIILYLVLIIAAAYFLTKFVAKRTLRKGMKGSGKKRPIEPGHLISVVDRIAVDRDKTIMVVEFRGKHYLIGTTAQEIKCLDSVDIAGEADGDQERNDGNIETEPGTAEGAERPGNAETFGSRFKKCMGIVLRSYLPKRMRNKEEVSPSFDKELRQKLDEKEHEKNKKTTSKYN